MREVECSYEFERPRPWYLASLAAAVAATTFSDGRPPDSGSHGYGLWQITSSPVVDKPSPWHGTNHLTPLENAKASLRAFARDNPVVRITSL